MDEDGEVTGQIVSVGNFGREIAVADTVPDLKALADKGAAIIDYMRKAGKFDDVTVNEITYRVGDAVRKAGALLEDIAPGQGARTDLTSLTGQRSYNEILNVTKMSEGTAHDWRAASKFGAEAYGKYLTKLRKQGERLKLRDLYRMGRPAQKRAADGAAASIIGALVDLASSFQRKPAK